MKNSPPTRCTAGSEHTAPDAALVVVDATNLERNLFLASQVLELKCPVIVALNMMDMARARRHSH